MRFSEMSKPQLRAARNELVRRLNASLRPSRIICLDDMGCTIEGGTFPATYNHGKRELSIWGRGNRYAGGSKTVSDLIVIQSIIVAFFIDYLEGDGGEAE